MKNYKLKSIKYVFLLLLWYKSPRYIKVKFFISKAWFPDFTGRHLGKMTLLISQQIFQYLERMETFSEGIQMWCARVTDWSPGTELGGGECKIHIELVREKICLNSKLLLLIYIPYPETQSNSSFSQQCFCTLKGKIISKEMICKVLPILDLNDTVKFHHGQFISSTILYPKRSHLLLLAECFTLLSLYIDWPLREREPLEKRRKWHDVHVFLS